jgi:hypothetical protein
MLKLETSLAEATALANEQPDTYKVGAHGWVTVKTAALGKPDRERLARWVDESYRLLASKQLTALLPDNAAGPQAPKSSKKAKRAN